MKLLDDYELTDIDSLKLALEKNTHNKRNDSSYQLLKFYLEVEDNEASSAIENKNLIHPVIFLKDGESDIQMQIISYYKYNLIDRVIEFLIFVLILQHSRNCDLNEFISKYKSEANLFSNFKNNPYFSFIEPPYFGTQNMNGKSNFIAVRLSSAKLTIYYLNCFYYNVEEFNLNEVLSWSLKDAYMKVSSVIEKATVISQK